MELGLKKKIDRFYEEMNREESFDIGELACDLIPDLVYKIKQLEKQIDELTSEKIDCDQL